jgi:hypothetical protein
MIVKTKKTEQVETKIVSLKDITSNTGQSRGLGVIPTLNSLGYGLFEIVEASSEKKPIWSMLIGDDREAQKEAAALLREHEPDVLAAAESREQNGQIQDPIVIEEGGSYDVMVGMNRLLAAAFLFAEDPKKNPNTADVKVWTGKISDVDRMFFSFASNNDVRQEGPIDKALFFQRMRKEHGLTTKDLCKRTAYSDQSITNYTKLLHPKIEDLRIKVQTGDCSIEKALKMLANRIAGDKDGDDSNGNGSPSGARARFPGAKKIADWYAAKKKPEGVEQKEWEMFVKDDVRAWVAFRLGKKFKPFSGELKSPEPEEEAPRKTKAAKLTIPKSVALRLLEALGKPEAAGWDDKDIIDKLENIPNLGLGSDHVLEEEKLQALYKKLFAYYSNGLVVKLK